MPDLALALAATLLLCPPPRCANARDCNAAGSRALREGRLAAAESAFDAQVHFAECEKDAGQTVLAYNNQALLALRRPQPLLARIWTDRALAADPDSRAARHNHRLAGEALARLPPAQGVTGSYRSYAGLALWDHLRVREVAPGAIRFALDVLRVGARRCEHPELRAAGDFSYVIPSQGSAGGRAELRGTEAVWETTEFGKRCRLRFSFGTDEAVLVQEGDAHDCGFGFGVRAEGTYRRADRRPPEFGPDEP